MLFFRGLDGVEGGARAGATTPLLNGEMNCTGPGWFCVPLTVVDGSVAALCAASQEAGIAARSEDRRRFTGKGIELLLVGCRGEAAKMGAVALACEANGLVKKLILPLSAEAGL